MSARTAFAATAAGVLALGLVPWARSPLWRLAGREGDGPDPHYDVPLDARALKSAATTLPPGSLYATIAEGESPLVQGNLKAAGQLYLWRHFPVQDAERDGVIVFTYRDGVVR